MATNMLSEHIKGLYNACSVKGKFPNIWKVVSLVLIPKPGKKDLGVPSSYRLVCMINEAGKMLEKIIAYRIWNHLSQTSPDISESQFGFRVGRST